MENCVFNARTPVRVPRLWNITVLAKSRQGAVCRGTGTRTVWVRISHSSGGAFGAESTAQSFTYADSGGSGGDTGDEEFFPHREYTLN